MAATPNVAVGGPVTQVQEPTPGSSIPFRRATTFRTAQLQTTAQLITTASQQVDVTIEGSGYVYGIDLHCFATTAGNGAGTAFQEDGPWSFIDTLVFRDVNGELVNASGYHTRVLNLYGGYDRFKDAPVRAETAPSADTANIFNVVTGAGATGGSFRFHTWVPVGLNRRDLRGILGNQDRSQKYSLRSDFGASTAIYTVSPTTLPTANIERIYENYAVPSGANANGAPQMQFPEDFGILHYSTQSVSPTAPQGSATVNHYLARLGNTIRLLICVIRSNGSRSTAESNMPTRLQFNLGDTPLFVETVAYRRMLMWRRYGFDAPNGVLVWDFMTDIIGQASDELGDDYLFTNGLVNAQFQFTYPAGMGSTNNSLTILTDDLVIPPTVDIYA
jgi:FlaG/FlaF family flagellin (archaellin)